MSGINSRPPPKHKFIRQVVELEVKLAAMLFTEHGYIYYARDAPRERSKNQSPLYGDDLKKFCVGPVVDPNLWPDKQAEIELNQGPCKPPNFLSICHFLLDTYGIC